MIDEQGAMLNTPEQAMVPQAQPQQQEIVLSREEMLKELHAHCKEFIAKSKEWRKNSFEDQWRRWQRNADCVYDPANSAKKEDWQSRAVWPITASHRENAQAQLFKTEVGPRPPLEVKMRDGIIPKEQDQSENIRDMVLRERDKCRYEVDRNLVIEDKTTYGSGFARVYFENRVEPRLFRTPRYEEVSLGDLGSLARKMAGQARIVGYDEEIKDAIVYRGIRFDYISIWDVFPDPKSLKVKGSPIAYRYNQTVQDILDGIAQGYYLPEAAEKLKGVDSAEKDPDDKQGVQTDRGIAESNLERPERGKLLECYELYAKLPQKWVLIDGQAFDDPDKLIPAIIRFTDMAVVMVGVNKSYDGEPLIVKDDYMPVAGQFYGRGIPEMLKDVQDVSTETVNQRLDNGAISLNTMFAVIEKYVQDPKDFKAGPGRVMRIKLPSGVNGMDIRQVLMKLDMGQLDRAAFIEPQEWERAAQERTSITRATLGTSGQLKDSNQTLGGMEMLKQASGDKLGFIGMLSEFGFQYDIFRQFWKLIYSNYEQEDIVQAIGHERAQGFILMTPEQIEECYQFIPMGIFTMDNKAMRQARLAQVRQQYAGAPWMNDVAFFEAQMQSLDEDPDMFMLEEAEAQQIQMKAQQMAQGMIGQAMQEKQIESKIKNALPDVQDMAGPMGVDQMMGDEDEKALDAAAARVAVKSGKVSEAEARRRLAAKHGGKGK